MCFFSTERWRMEVDYFVSTADHSTVMICRQILDFVT